MSSAKEAGVDGCCVPAPGEAGDHACPVSGGSGQRVDSQTVAALIKGRVPPRQSLWLCRDPDCKVVYFGSAGFLVERRGVHVEPGFKRGSEGLVCYCFLHHASAVEGEVRETGSSGIFDRIRGEVRAGNCACEVRNPSGKCCLADVKRIVEAVATQTTRIQ